jgi:hypothetical protein
MNDDELKQLWHEQPLRIPPAPSPSQLIAAMQSKTTQLRRTLFGRDLRELAACVFVAVIFGSFSLQQSAPSSRVGALITVAASIFVAAKILYARRKTPAPPADATVVESLRAELHSVRTQSQMLASVLWWYLLPIAVGSLVFVWGQPGNSLGFKIGFTIVSLAFDVFIYRLNQTARSTQLLPVEAQLESLLRSAETGEAINQSHAANLRPIVLSMAAADHVKPVEFKVAFWQLALWGEIGFIGIWFFFMIGLSWDHNDWRDQKPLPQSALVQGTNRYTTVARQVVERLNAHDFSAVQKLYSADMSETFPPKETTDFYNRLTSAYGKIKKTEGLREKGYGGWTAFRLHCDNGELTMSLSLDDNDEIDGIYFQPVTSFRTAFRSAARQMFSWKRLVWLVPFILGGALYSWLVQKTTKRAVGISSLGIHLSKGQKLILWDEIKEIRPFRFLHIRNLWVITESGEKTRMHWTPLERHADLKAAVERFAPANHPIRNYLPLLKRS